MREFSTGAGAGAPATCTALGREHHDGRRLVGILGRKDELAVVLPSFVDRVLGPGDDKVPLKDVVGPGQSAGRSERVVERPGDVTS